jgi:IS1 family transposase
MNKLSSAKKVAVISALVEGCSVRATSRMTDVAKGTILRLLAAVGTACAEYQDRTLRGLICKRVQIDEIWSFCYAKQKAVTPEMLAVRPAGDVWTFVAIEAQSKLVLGWRVGNRDGATATAFVKDIAGRLSSRIQLTTDGHRMYLDAVEQALGASVDYAMLVKLYGAETDGQRTYSPAQCIGARIEPITGAPDRRPVSTSYIERQNLTMRMNMRRFTRLTNGFSKKLENHIHSIALFYMHYNFVRIHQTPRVTPAMEAGVSDHVWSLEDIVALAEKKTQRLAA